MNEHRRQILEMLAAGRISPEEADRLLAAAEDTPPPAQPTAVATAERPLPRTGLPKYLRVLVDVNEEEEGPVKVNVRIPLQLLRAGVKLASLIPPQAQEEVNRSLRERGFPFDVTQIKPENVDELIEQLHDLTVDVDQQKDNVKVRIFCE